jgi:raffinose/stachyose/melibiose transport system permease protein
MRRLIATFFWILCLVSSGRAEAPVRIEVPVFVGGFGIGFFENAARDFEAERPWVQVDLHGDPRIADRLGVRLLAGDVPDVTDANLPWSRLIAAGEILDLTPYLDGPNWEGDRTWRESFLPGVLDRWTVDGRVYGLPFAHAVWGFFYDKRVFARHGWVPPATWDEFFALAEAQRRAGYVPLAFPGQVMRYIDPVWRHAYLNLAGPEAFARFARLDPEAWTDPRMERAFALAARLARETFGRGWEGTSHTGAQLALLEGRAAMTLSATWIASEMRNALPDGFELGMFNFPTFGEESATHPDILQTGSGYYFVFARGAHPEVSVDFLRFLTSRARAEAFVRLTDAPTAVAGTAGALSPLMADAAGLIGRSQGTIDYPPQTVGPQAAIAPALASVRQALLQGRIPPSEAGLELRRATEAELKRQASPGSVRVRHGGKAMLLGLVVGALLFLGWRGSRSRGFEGGAGCVPGQRGAFAAFTLPAFLVYGLFVLIPAGLSIAWSLRRWDGVGEASFAGLSNYKWLVLESDIFWTALSNNLFLMLVPTLFVVPVALFLAALLNRGVVGAGFFRAVVLFPNLLGGIAGALIWLNVYEPVGGLLNAMLVATGKSLQTIGLDGLGGWLADFDAHAWLSSDRLYWSLIPIYLWLATGFNVVLYLAAMQGVDRELYEAAAIDGAGAWRTFTAVTLPGIRGTLLVTAIFFVIGGINTFEMVWLLTGQDPAVNLHTLGTWMVQTLFREFQVGRAAALAVVMSLLVLVAAAGLRGLFGKEET